MKEITERERIENFYTRWCETYRVLDNPKTKELEQLDFSKVSKKEVDDIIGNSSWTDNICCNCRKHRKILIVFNDNMYGYDENMLLCEHCLIAGLKFIENLKDGAK